MERSKDKQHVMKHVLGIDIGNSKTLYTLADKTGVVKHVYYGKGANYQRIGRENTIKTLQTGISRVIQGAHVHVEDVGFIYYGAAGADSPKDFGVLKDIFHQVTPTIPFDFENDGWISLKSGTLDGVGMVVTCGSGNTNFAMNSSGETKRIGGLNEILGDVLGASMIASYTCRAAARSADGRDYPTILTRMIPDALGVNELIDIINLPRNTDLVKTVIHTLFRAVEMGDGKALEIIWSLTKEVLDIVREFYAALFVEDQHFKLVLDGSVFRAKYQPLMTMLDLALHQRYQVDIIVPDWDPVVGALLYAFEKSGIPLTKDMFSRIIQTYQDCEVAR